VAFNFRGPDESAVRTRADLSRPFWNELSRPERIDEETRHITPISMRGRRHSRRIRAVRAFSQDRSITRRWLAKAQDQMPGFSLSAPRNLRLGTGGHLVSLPVMSRAASPSLVIGSWKKSAGTIKLVTEFLAK